jgi:hypothetical protein
MKLPSYSFLIPASLLLGLAPFVPEPHLVEKIRMLFAGDLRRPIDIFDLFLHGAFPLLLLVKGGSDLAKRVGREGGPGGTGAGDGGRRDGGADAPRTRAERRRAERERNKRNR